MKKIYADSFIEAVFNGERPIISGDIRFQAVFMMGLPGSGKSHVKTRRYLQHAGFVDIDPDEIKKRHPDYDPEHPFAVHEWSKEIADRQFRDTLKTGDPFVLDGTGTTATNMATRMDIARKSDYRIFLVYVYTPIEISLFRNRNRKRFVREKVIMDKAIDIGQSFAILRGIADKTKVVRNFEEDEQAKAMEDMAFYPPPYEERPPRPGDANYGLKKVASRRTR